MNDRDIYTLLSERIGVRKIKANSSGWINATCPFEARHGGGRDENPSFGIHVATQRSSKFNCQSGACRIKGDNLIGLIFALHQHHVTTPRSLEQTFWWVLERDNSLLEAKARQDQDERRNVLNRPSRVYNWMASFAPITPSNPDGKVTPLLELALPTPPVVLPDSDLDGMRELSEAGRNYLLGKRRLSEGTIQAWELGNRGSRVAIPIRDHEQRLVGISGRLLEGFPGGPKYLHSTGFKRDLFLYGESKVVKGRTGRIVEGFFDVIGLWQSGYQNPVGIMGSYPSKQQIEKIVRWFTDVDILGDGDKAGREMAQKVYEALRPFIPARIIEMPESRDPDDLSLDEKIERLGPPDRSIDNRLSI